MNEGKKFENDFKASVPKDVFYYRFRDGTANHNPTEESEIRFQHTNIADNELFYNGHLFILELKSVAKASIPYGNIFNKKKKTSLKKLSDMKEASLFPQLITGYVVNFRKYNRTWFMTTKQLFEYLNRVGDSKASIPVAYFDENCLPVNVQRDRKAKRYDIKRFLNFVIDGDYNKGKLI